MSDRLWDLLKDQGSMLASLRHLRQLREAELGERDAKSDEPGDKRASEQSMEESAKFKRNRVGTDTVEREKRAREALEEHVKAKAKETRRPETEVRKEFEEEAKNHPYRVEFEPMPGAPFFRVEQIGGLKVLKINMSHRFYTDLYMGSTRRNKAALEVLLFAIGECELDAQGNLDRRTFYAVERAAWSEGLSSALGVLQQFVHDTDVADSGEEPKAAATDAAA
jgi:hypothetical protein